MYWPYLRNEETLARPWAIPGTPGLMHHVGGIEKRDGSGNIDYTPDNHERMCELRAAKVDRVATDIPPTEVTGDVDAEILVLGWGSTWAAIDAAVQRRRRAGLKVARTHITHLSPLPPDLGDILSRYQKVLLPELNRGQLAQLLRGLFLKDITPVSKVQGLPFKSAEIEDAIDQAHAELKSEPSTNVRANGGAS